MIEYIKEHIEVEQNRDGSVNLKVGDEGMDTDLWFASSAMKEEDPLLAKQKAILETIVKAVMAYNP